MSIDEIVAKWHNSVVCGEPTLIESNLDDAFEQQADRSKQDIMREMLYAWSRLKPVIHAKYNASFCDARIHRLTPRDPIGDLFFATVCQLAATDVSCHTAIIEDFIHNTQ